MIKIKTSRAKKLVYLVGTYQIVKQLYMLGMSYYD